ncbi:hypothetical protein ACJX0J_030048 [Zea mays]
MCFYYSPVKNVLIVSNKALTYMLNIYGILLIQRAYQNYKAATRIQNDFRTCYQKAYVTIAGFILFMWLDTCSHFGVTNLEFTICKHIGIYEKGITFCDTFFLFLFIHPPRAWTRGMGNFDMF